MRTRSNGSEATSSAGSSSARALGPGSRQKYSKPSASSGDTWDRMVRESWRASGERLLLLPLLLPAAITATTGWLLLTRTSCLAYCASGHGCWYGSYESESDADVKDLLEC